MPLPAIRAIAIDSLRFIYGARGFLRDDLPTEASGVQKFTQEFGRRACRRYARARGTLAGVSYSPIWSTVCDPYLDSISEGPTSGGSYAQPFSGGQCPIAYRITYSGVAISNPDAQGQGGGEVFSFEGGSQGFNKYPVGPIRGIRIGASNPADCVISNGLQIQVVTAGGVVGFGCFAPPNQPSQFVPKSVQFTSITPLSQQQQDNCGNPPPEYRPPTFPPNLPTLPTPTNPAPGFGNNWDIDILPDGKVKFCIASDCSEGVPPNGGGGPDSGGGPGEEDGDPQETDPNDPNNPNEVSGCVEEDRILTGLKIEVTQAPPNYQGLGTIYYRSCWVWMGPNSELLDMVIDGRTIENDQFVIPDSRDCTCYKVRANPGFRISVQAYSRPKEE